LLQGIYFFIEVLVHVGFEHPVPVMRSQFHDVSIRSITTRIHVKGEKEETLCMGNTRTRRPLPVPC
jgi:hypothetical protein